MRRADGTTRRRLRHRGVPPPGGRSWETSGPRHVSTRDDVAERLGRALGGTVTSVRGSRVARRGARAPSSCRPRGRRVERSSSSSTRGGRDRPRASRSRPRCCAQPTAPGSRSRGCSAPAAPTGSTPGWLVVERLEGETIPRRLLRDHALRRRARAAHRRRRRARSRGSTRSTPRGVPGLPVADPFERPLELLDATGEVRPVLELARAVARTRTALRPRGAPSSTATSGWATSSSTRRGCAGVLDWELAHAGDPAEDLGWLTREGMAVRRRPARSAGSDDSTTCSRSTRRRAAASRRRHRPMVAGVRGAQVGRHLRAPGRRAPERRRPLGRARRDRSPGLRERVGPPRAHGRPSDPRRRALPRRRAHAPSTVRARPTDRTRAGRGRRGVPRHQGLGALEGAPRFDARVARNVLEIVARELAVGPAHRGRAPRAARRARASPTTPRSRPRSARRPRRSARRGRSGARPLRSRPAARRESRVPRRRALTRRTARRAGVGGSVYRSGTTDPCTTREEP